MESKITGSQEEDTEDSFEAYLSRHMNALSPCCAGTTISAAMLAAISKIKEIK